MPPEAGLGMEHFAGLADRAPESVVFIEDGNEVTAFSLQTGAGILAGRMREAGPGRAAVFSNRPSVLSACLLACLESGQELLISRAPYLADSGFWKAAGVGAVVDESDLQLHRITGSTAAASGEAAVLIPTSGTSGAPKIVRHRMASLMGRIRPGNSPRGARWLLTYQANGFAGLQIILTTLATDATLVSLSEMDVPRLAEAAVARHVTHISGTPTFWRTFLLCLGSSTALPDLEQITLGGEVVDQGTLDRLRRVFPGAGVSHIYASTEAGALFSVRDGQAGFPAGWLEKPVDGVSLRIRDGVLEVRSPRAMLGYLDKQNVSLCADGWLVTGDRVEQRNDRVYFLGREDSVINVGGSKVTPEEVEAALLDHPRILDLRAFGAPNPITGWVVGLEVVAAPGSDTESLHQEILAMARQKLVSYKVPRLIRFVDEVLCDVSGKKSRKAGP